MFVFVDILVNNTFTIQGQIEPKEGKSRKRRKKYQFILWPVLALLNSICHISVVKEQGKPHRSKPYRFRTFNGSYVTLETEWLCFVNPWTKKIDSIIGQHRVLKVSMILGVNFLLLIVSIWSILSLLLFFYIFILRFLNICRCKMKLRW